MIVVLVVVMRGAGQRIDVDANAGVGEVELLGALVLRGGVLSDSGGKEEEQQHEAGDEAMCDLHAACVVQQALALLAGRPPARLLLVLLLLLPAPIGPGPGARAAPAPAQQRQHHTVVMEGYVLVKVGKKGLLKLTEARLFRRGA